MPRYSANLSFPPGPSGKQLSAMFDHSRDALDVLAALRDEYGDVVGYTLPIGRVVLVNGPAEVADVLGSEVFERTDTLKFVLGEGLISADDRQWQRTRRGVQNWFGAESLARLEPIIRRAIDTTRANWNRAAQRGEPIDVHNEMTRLTFEVITEAIFGRAAIEDPAAFSRAVTDAMDYMSVATALQLGMPAAFNPQVAARARHAMSHIERVIGNLLDAAGSDADVHADSYLTLTARTLSGLGDAAAVRKRLRDELLTLLIAGHETTSTALSWTWHLLGTNAPAAARLREELHNTLGDVDVRINDRTRLPFSRNVLYEAMRMYPPVWTIARRAAADTQVGGYAVPRGTSVLVNTYTLHRNPTAWEDPERFDPDRFTEDASRQRHRHAFIPFGSGHHVCLGANFAMCEATMVIADLARSFDVTPAPGREPRRDVQISLRPRGLCMKINPLTKPQY